MSDTGDSAESPPPNDSAPQPSSNSSNSSPPPNYSSNQQSAVSPPPSDTKPPEKSATAPPPEKSTPPPASIPSPPSSSGSPPAPSKQLSPPPPAATPPTQQSSPPPGPPPEQQSSPPPSPPPEQQSPPSPSPSNQPPPPRPSSPPKQQSPPPSSTPNQQSPPPSSTPNQQSPPTAPKQQSPPPPPTPLSPAPPTGPSRDPSQSPPQKSPALSPPQPPPSPENLQPPPSANPKSTPHGSPPHTLAPRAPSPPKSPSNSSGGSSNSGGSGNDKQNHVNDSKNTHYEVVIDVAVAGVFIIAFVALFFFIRRRKKRQPSLYPNYMPPPANFGVKSDAAYYKPQVPGTQSNLANNSESQRGQSYHGPDSGIITGSKTFFTYEELMEMTNGFARENVIGEGGFGCVYKGRMHDGRFVAVKQLKAGSGQGEREFRAEVEIISRVHHRHLVSLVGYCIAENHRLLIYEFVSNKTLEHHLHAKELPVLEWAKRVKIAIGAAKGLAYLHEDCHPRIIHRDIKSANILLEDDFEAQVADFGLARLNDTTQTHVSTRVMGTFGYLAPEYASSGKLTDRSDVYSFGVVLLELITGRKPVDPTQPLGDESLVEWARPILIQALETGDFGELIDPRLEKRYVESQMFMMIEAAAACVRHSAAKRPRMALVVRALDFDGKSDLSNGVKFGHSTVYDSGQYNEEIMNFRRMALGSDNSSESDMYSGEYNTREVVSRAGQPPWKSGYSSGDFTSGDSETNQSSKQNSGEYSVVASVDYGGGGRGGRFK